MAKDSKKPKGGWVYVGESKRSDGTKKHYVGSTTRDVKTREKEHKSEVRKKNSKTWVGKGSSYKTIGSFWSKNPRADEKKVKAMSRSERKKLVSSKKSTRTSTKKKVTKKSSVKKKTIKRKTTTKSKPKTSTKKRVTRKKSSAKKTTTTRRRTTRKAPPRRRTYRSRRR